MKQSDAFQYIDDLPVIEYNKKNRGEVFTKISIVKEHLAALPNSLWKKKNMRWLDIASGVGNYTVFCYFKLMNTLNNVIKSNSKRSKHIIEKMLFMVEIDKGNAHKCRELFRKIDPKASPNIFIMDFLTFHTNKKFNVIIGNPPYTTPNAIDNTKLSTRSLYPYFISHSLSFLKKRGYLSLIHPVSWRRYSRESRFSFENYNILYIYTNNNFKGFGDCAPYINYYVVQNKNTINHLTKYTTIYKDKTYTGSVSLRNLPFLPLLISKESISIIRKLLTNSNSIITNNNRDNDEKQILSSTNIPIDIKLISMNSTSKKSINKEKTTIYPHKNIHNYSKKTQQYSYRYSKKKHISHNLQKIIMIYRGGHEYFYPFYNKGNIGITDNAIFMKVDNKTKNTILQFLKSDLVIFILKTCNYNYGKNMKTEYKILNMIQIPYKIDLTNNPASTYKHFDINKKEQVFIENIV